MVRKVYGLLPGLRREREPEVALAASGPSYIHYAPNRPRGLDESPRLLWLRPGEPGGR